MFKRCPLCGSVVTAEEKCFVCGADLTAEPASDGGAERILINRRTARYWLKTCLPGLISFLFSAVWTAIRIPAMKSDPGRIGLACLFFLFSAVTLVLSAKRKSIEYVMLWRFTETGARAEVSRLLWTFAGAVSAGVLAELMLG